MPAISICSRGVPGPLLASAGRLIGINTAIYSPSGAYAGIGFAVPVDTANRVVPQLIAHGKYLRPSLGIVVDADINRVVAQQLGVTGVVVVKVQAGTAGEAAGLRGMQVDSRGEVVPGDVILAIDGKKVETVAALFSRLDDYRIGDEVRLRVWRSGREANVAVVLEAGR